MDKDTLLILGASSDVGIELIKRCDRPDLVIFAHYNSNKDVIESIKENASAEIIPVKANLIKEEDILFLIEKISSQCSHPNKIVHLPASKFENIRFKNMQWNQIQQDIDLQLKSITIILQRYLPLMAKAKKGKVIFMLSSCTFNVPPRATAHYVTVKYALMGLMKSLAAEYAEKKININAVSPSMMETKFLEKIPEKIIEITAAGHPLKRNAIPKDVVPLIFFLLSEESDYINGLNILVAGGGLF